MGATPRNRNPSAELSRCKVHQIYPGHAVEARAALGPVTARTLDVGHRPAQVTSLALCKHNKNDLLLHKLRRRVRHGRARSLFWRYNEVPKEVLKVLQVAPPRTPLPHYKDFLLSFSLCEPRRFNQLSLVRR